MRISPIQNYQYNQQVQNNNKSVAKPISKSMATPSFEQIKPEYMFINTKGYAKDMDWAKTTVNIINDGKKLIQKDTKFFDLIEYVTNRYNAYYRSFGLFQGNQHFGARRFAVTGNRIVDKYAPYKEKAKNFLESRTTGDFYRMHAYLPSQDKVVELTSVKKTNLGDDYSMYIEAPNITVIDPVLEEVNSIYKSIKKETDQDKITNSVAQIHWLISQARPYTRGSAGVADMLSKMIFEAKNIQVSEYKKDINPNLEAFFMPMKEYCEKYSTFFAEPLKPIIEEVAEIQPKHHLGMFGILK